MQTQALKSREQQTKPREATALRNPREDGEYITGLARGLSVLRAFSKDCPDPSLSQIAAATSLNPAVVRRCLNTLVHLGYVARNGRRFRLRPEVMLFTSAFLESAGIEDLVEPHLKRLRDETGDSTSMAVLSGDDIVYLVHAPTNRIVPVATGIGARLPARDTALGRILLAYSDPEHPAAGAPARARSVMFDTQSIVERGYAPVVDELGSGVTSIAVPVMRTDGRIFAAINCATTAVRLSQNALVKSRLPSLNAARASIEEQLERYPALARAVI